MKVTKHFIFHITNSSLNGSQVCGGKVFETQPEGGKEENTLRNSDYPLNWIELKSTLLIPKEGKMARQKTPNIRNLQYWRRGKALHW